MMKEHFIIKSAKSHRKPRKHCEEGGWYLPFPIRLQTPPLDPTVLCGVAPPSGSAQNRLLPVKPQASPHPIRTQVPTVFYWNVI